ncbi:MAG: hypothetical protein V4666_02520 [Bacteroidota bacterium]
MKNTLDFISILSTVVQVEQEEKHHLVEKLDYILTNNEIEKPELHNRKDDLTTSYFRIDISEKELEEILDVISNSIANSFDQDSKPTVSTKMFEILYNEWSQISPN